jgi:alpha-L-fucosidase
MVALLAAATLLLNAGAPRTGIVQKAAHLAPTPRQMAWQREELTAFIHFGPDTYTGREIGLGTENPAIFAPKHLDTDQWIRELKSAGFRKVILVTKHHDGLVLWPTRYTKYHANVDVVGSFVRSARKYGIAIGFYLSPADLHEAQPGGRYANGSKPRESTIGRFRFNVDDYNRYYMHTLYELLTHYGPIEEVWLDGFNPLKDRKQPYDFADWYRLIRALQPNAVIFGGPDVAWVGDEDGIARKTQWSVVAFTGMPRPDQATFLHDPTSPKLGGREDLTDPKTTQLRWYPSECDARLEKTWFWHPHQPPKTLAELQQMYYTSTGRNCQLLLDVPPDQSGHFDAADVRRLREFGAWIRGEFAQPLASSSTSTIALRHPVRFQTIGLQEDVSQGQRVERFTIEAQQHGAWREIASGTTIGYKRLLLLPSPVAASQIRVRVLQSRDTPHLLRFSVYR